MTKSIQWTIGFVLLALAIMAPGAMALETAMVPMRDGTKLALDYFLPAEGGSAFPVVLVRSTYDRGDGMLMAALFNGKGYAFAIQDTRGRGAARGRTRRLRTMDGEAIRTASIRWAGSASSLGAMARSAHGANPLWA